MNFLGQPVVSFNVEPTNKCVLKCSACDRTLRPEAVKTLEDINPEVFRKVLFEDLASTDLSEVTFDFCGIYGDSIYHKDLFNILRLIKQRGAKIGIGTNGSYKDAEWWETLVAILDERDFIVFSVDGLEDTNHIYRENSHWPSTYMGMKIAAKSRVTTIWKFIVFKHNQHQIERAKGIAKELGFDRFLVRKSGRFTEDDPLKPDDQYVGMEQDHREYVKSGKPYKIVPRCTRMENERRNIGFTYQGYIIPCLTFHSVHNEWFEEHKDRISVLNRNIVDILADPLWEDLQKLWEDPKKAPEICSTYCGAPKYKEIDPNRIKIFDHAYFDL